MHELGGVHGVVGEQNVLLHVFHVDAGVVLDAGAGDVEALRPEVEKREFGAVEGVPVAVDNCVVDFIQGGAWDDICNITSTASFGSGRCAANVLRWDADI